MQSSPEKLLEKHHEMVHTEMSKVTSHVQRKQGEWIINSLMIEGCSVPFKYKRQKMYKDLKGRRVNLTYYPSVEKVGDVSFEIMKVVRIKIA